MFHLAAVQTHLALFCKTVHIGENKLGIFLINTNHTSAVKNSGYKCALTFTLGLKYKTKHTSKH